MAIYLLVGAVGVPVFAEFTGGLGIVFGDTGGYLLSYPLAAAVAGLAAYAAAPTPRGGGRSCWRFLWGAAALAVIYALGATWLSVVADLPTRGGRRAGRAAFRGLRPDQGRPGCARRRGRRPGHRRLPDLRERGARSEANMTLRSWLVRRRSRVMFEKVLVANRGEIALRVVRACQELGVAAVAVYSDADESALHVRHADEAVRIGPPPAGKSYLDVEALIDAAKETGAEAVHPGYGFLAENAAFAAACREAGLAFVGPSAEAIEKMGNKSAARRLAREAEVPVVPGSDDASSADEAAETAGGIGYPIMVKAAAGGGGRGIRVAEDEDELSKAVQVARREAEAAFGDGTLYLEKLLVAPRHVEVQIMGDHEGNVIHLYERECSMQRRRQKVLEEAPSPGISPEVREKMTEAAVRLAREAGYANAGTVEFLVEGDEFYFIEMNTRIQVEHPVTEMLTGVDLVKEQIRIAAGEPLSLNRKTCRWSGTRWSFASTPRTPTRTSCPRPARSPRSKSQAAPASGWTRRSTRGTRSPRSTTRWSASSSSGPSPAMRPSAGPDAPSANTASKA